MGSSFLTRLNTKLGNRRREKYQKNIEKTIGGTRNIWHFCTPKSASTNLAYRFKHLALRSSEISYIYPRAFGGSRPQTIDFGYVVSQQKHAKKTCYFERIHSCFTTDLQRLIGKNDIVIIQYRSILDTLVSLIDHMDKSPNQCWAPNADLFWGTIGFDEKIIYLTHYYLPFHLNFIYGWLQFKENKNSIWIDYDSFIECQNEMFSEIIEQIGLAPLELYEPTVEEMNLNVGKKGRGEEKISAEIKKEIYSKISDLNLFGNDIEKYLF